MEVRLMTARDVHNELEDRGYDINGVVAWSDRYFVVGKMADDLPDVNGKQPIDDPNLVDRS